VNFLHPKTELIGSFGTLRAEELRGLVETEKKQIQVGQVPLLEAAMEPAFLAKFLAHFESGAPMALVSPDLSPSERAQRESILNHKLHPDCAVIVFTSGSTGVPKAVQLSRANLEANTEAVIESLQFAKAPRQGLFLSLSYSYGLFGQLLPALHLGISTRLFPKFADVRAAILAGEGAGMWSGVPSHWEALLRVTTPEQCDGVTHVISAGAALPLELRKRLQAHFRQATLFNNYGLTEASPRVLSLPSTHPRFYEEGTVGYAVKHLAVKEGEAGELLLKGKQVMLGYLGDPSGTAEKIQAGWLHSGDVVQVEADGMVRIMGRMDDLFNIGGERTSPLEIDAALLKVPGVKEAAVLVDNHELYGARLAAFLVGEEGLKKKPIVEELKKHLSGHKIPLEFFRVDSLPRTPNGKLRRKELVPMKASATRIS
jgi:long-chain acyl-CoA synthetase